MATRTIAVLEGTRELGRATTAATHTTTTVIPITPPTGLVIAAGATPRTLRVTLDTAGLTAATDRVTASIVADAFGASVTLTPAVPSAATIPVSVPGPTADLGLIIDGTAITLLTADNTAVLVAARIAAATFTRVSATTTFVGAVPGQVRFARTTGVVSDPLTIAVGDAVFTGGTIPVSIPLAGGIAAVAQVTDVTIAGTGHLVGDVYRVIVDGIEASFTGSAAPVAIRDGLISAINTRAGAIVTASISPTANTVRVTRNVPNISFTTTASVALSGASAATITVVPVTAPAPVVPAAAIITVSVPGPTADLTLSIDGVTITLATTDTTPALVAARIAAAPFTNVSATTIGVPAGSAVRFTRTIDVVSDPLTIIVGDHAFTGGTIPPTSFTLTGGTAAIAGANFIWSDGVVDIHSHLVPAFPVTGDTLRL
ncbi:MAG: hypothetical protein DDT32_02352 [Syntrophomonadaceae bacterium]|nr:hypothetical protein [Bacillota bacterium]